MSQADLLQTEAKMMKLDKLIAQREAISAKPFPVPIKELLKRYEQLYPGAINDVKSAQPLDWTGIGTPPLTRDGKLVLPEPTKRPQVASERPVHPATNIREEINDPITAPIQA
jgi:hypothetical protein